MKQILQLILVFSIISFTGSYLVSSKVTAEEHLDTEQEEKKSKKSTVKDRVCGMKIKRDQAIRIKYEGKSYFFCSKDCEESFHADPSKYEKKGKKKEGE